MVVVMLAVLQFPYHFLSLVAQVAYPSFEPQFDDSGSASEIDKSQIC